MNKVSRFIKKIPKETITGTIFLLFGIVLLVEILKINNMESAILAYVVIGLYFAMCVWIILSGIIGKNKQPMEGFYYKLKEVVLLALLFLLYFLTKYISFYILAVPFVFTVNMIITKDCSVKNIITSLIFAICLSACIFALCRYGLKISI